MDSFQIEERLKESLERAASKLLEKSDQGLIDIEDALEILKETAIESYNQAISEKTTGNEVNHEIHAQVINHYELLDKFKEDKRQKEKVLEMLAKAMGDIDTPVNAHSLGPFEVKVETYNDSPLK